MKIFDNAKKIARKYVAGAIIAYSSLVAHADDTNIIQRPYFSSMTSTNTGTNQTTFLTLTNLAPSMTYRTERSTDLTNWVEFGLPIRDRTSLVRKHEERNPVRRKHQFYRIVGN